MAWGSRQGRGRNFPIEINLSLAEGHPISGSSIGKGKVHSARACLGVSSLRPCIYPHM